MSKKKSAKKAKTRSLPLMITILSALVIAFFLCGFIGGRIYYDRRCPNFSDKAEIYVYPNMNISDVMEEIVSKNIVKKRGSLKRALRQEGLLSGEDKPGENALKPGHYTITADNSSMYVARMLRNGWQTPVKMVLSGSMRHKSVIARKISRQMMMDSLTVMNALRDSALLSKYGFTSENVFALFMPDTYQVYWTDSINVILDKQKAAYDSFWTEDNVKKAKAQGLTKMEVSTLASIVRCESNHIPEYPLIAGVYLNRLHQGMKLQADPTIAYCYEFTLNRILRKHLKYDSPYNTYMYAGLPPAPICVPGKDAMEAVLNPQGGKDLFFCASPDFNGTHLFAATYSDHLKNAKAFQKALTAKLKAQQQQQKQ